MPAGQMIDRHQLDRDLSLLVRLQRTLEFDGTGFATEDGTSLVIDAVMVGQTDIEEDDTLALIAHQIGGANSIVRLDLVFVLIRSE